MKHRLKPFVIVSIAVIAVLVMVAGFLSWRSVAEVDAALNPIHVAEDRCGPNPPSPAGSSSGAVTCQRPGPTCYPVPYGSHATPTCCRQAGTQCRQNAVKWIRRTRKSIVRLKQPAARDFRYVDTPQFLGNLITRLRGRWVCGRMRLRSR
ncbi:hypothetical protein Rcae01_02004 [Novipirellula caenicola]|uniref:Uncharacterized protein n=1 Tax=Novipirellula caenicola TaxID=1536901 RepID=A0ABP9VMZ2_9BACT